MILIRPWSAGNFDFLRAGQTAQGVKIYTGITGPGLDAESSLAPAPARLPGAQPRLADEKITG
jgi:hypothetical protein